MEQYKPKNISNSKDENMITKNEKKKLIKEADNALVYTRVQAWKTYQETIETAIKIYVKRMKEIKAMNNSPEQKNKSWYKSIKR